MKIEIVTIERDTLTQFKADNYLLNTMQAKKIDNPTYDSQGSINPKQDCRLCRILTDAVFR